MCGGTSERVPRQRPMMCNTACKRGIRGPGPNNPSAFVCRGPIVLFRGCNNDKGIATFSSIRPYDSSYSNSNKGMTLKNPVVTVK